MKIRQGFVSNSSSSSFLVGFKDIPTSKAEVSRLLFGIETCAHCGHTPTGFSEPYGDGIMDADAVADRVWRDIEFADPLTEDQIVTEVNDGYISDVDAVVQSPEYLAHGSPEQRAKIWADYEVKHKKASAEFAAKLPFAGLHVFQFTYSDNDGSFESNMEHGDIFRNLPHLRISHH